jgi:methyl-accepting chemotaxis protein
MNISQKLNLLLISSVVALIAMIYFGEHNASQIAHTQYQLQLVEQLEVSALSMRKYEKDFFIYLKEEYPQKHSQEYDLFIEKMNRLDPLIVGDIGALTQKTTAYREGFVQAVGLQKTIGLTPTSGLYGELRAAVQNVEKKLGAITTTAAGAKLLADVLMLRRHEKDFMLRRDVSYVDKLVKDAKVFEVDLDKSPLDDDDIAKFKSLMNLYQLSFLALVENEKKMGTPGLKGLRDTMDDQAKQMEDNLAVFASNADTKVEQIKARSFWKNIVLSSSIALVLLGLTWNTRRSVLNPINAIMVQMQTITQTGKLEHRVPITSKDEFGEIAASFNALLDGMQGVVKETIHVMGSMAEGRLQERMSGNYP